MPAKLDITKPQRLMKKGDGFSDLKVQSVALQSCFRERGWASRWFPVHGVLWRSGLLTEGLRVLRHLTAPLNRRIN